MIPAIQWIAPPLGGRSGREFDTFSMCRQKTIYRNEERIIHSDSAFLQEDRDWSVQVFDNLSREDVDRSRSDPCEANLSYPSNLIKNNLFQKFLDEICELKLEILLLREEILKNRQRIIALESKKKSQGKEVRRRVDSMLLLLVDYGGSLTSSSIKAYMGLSKDELYRTLKCARDEDLIEVSPDPRDRRGYILSIKTDVSRNNQDS